MTTTKAIQLDAKVVEDIAKQCIAKIESERKIKAAEYIQEWVTSQNEWRSLFGWMGVKPYTEEDFHSSLIVWSDSFLYEMIKNRLHDKDEQILHGLVMSAYLAIKYGNDLMWLSAKEATALASWELLLQEVK
jgi:hypothetical protein